MTPALRDAFLRQAEACATLGSALMSRLFSLMAAGFRPEGALAERLDRWPGDVSANGASVPLRLAGALHALARAGRAPGLAAIYADVAPVPDAVFLAAVNRTCAAEAAFVLEFIESAPQTNELRRSATIIAAAHWLYHRCGLPLVLSELGASAGANLIWDRYALATPAGVLGPAQPLLTLAPDWRGAPPAAAPHPPVAARAGADLNPVDPVTGRERLLAYLWADQPERLARTARVLDTLADDPPRIDRADAIDWLEDRLRQRYPGALHLVFHTIAWQYFPAAGQDRGEALLADAGRRASAEAPLARFAMEADGRAPGAALTLDLWPEGRRVRLGRADFHGRWIDWQPGAA